MAKKAAATNKTNDDIVFQKTEGSTISTNGINAGSQNKATVLTIAERFVQCLANRPQVPRLSAKLSLAIFQSAFSSKAARIDGWIRTVINACAQVRESSRFGTLLQVVLALGNTLNALGTSHRPASAAGGFRLSSLAVLANTKSFDDSTCALCDLQASI